MKAIAFSRDRALQLDGMLRSLALHAAEPVDVEVIYKATTQRHKVSYETLGYETGASVTLANEYDFEGQVRRLLADAGEHIVFLVDDTIFVRGWSPDLVANLFNVNRGAIGFSLRLGRNTRHCYPMNRKQAVPDMPPAGPHGYGIAGGWRWSGADGDFGYPLEVSSSGYRTADILAVLDGLRFANPNVLEACLANGARTLPLPWLMSYETSVAFSNPCNRVQTTFANRTGDAPASSADALLGAWEAGARMKVETYMGHVPSGCHQEVPIVLEARP